MRSMKAVVQEYNALMGTNIKRFATVAVGEKRLAAAKASREIKPVSKHKRGGWKLTKVSVDGKNYRSTLAAFIDLGLPTNKHGKFRLLIKKDGSANIDHNGKTFTFTLYHGE